MSYQCTNFEDEGSWNENSREDLKVGFPLNSKWFFYLFLRIGRSNEQTSKFIFTNKVVTKRLYHNHLKSVMCMQLSWLLQGSKNYAPCFNRIKCVVIPSYIELPCLPQLKLVLKIN